MSLNFHRAKKKSLSVYQICQKVGSSLACEAGSGHIYSQKEQKTSKILKFWWLDSFDIFISFFAVYFKEELCCFFSFLTCDRNEKKKCRVTAGPLRKHHRLWPSDWNEQRKRRRFAQPHTDAEDRGLGVRRDRGRRPRLGQWTTRERQYLKRVMSVSLL